MRRVALGTALAMLLGSAAVFAFAWTGYEFASLHAEIHAARLEAQRAERSAARAELTARAAQETQANADPASDGSQNDSQADSQ